MKFHYALFLLIALSGCSPFTLPHHQDKQPLTKNTLNLLNGSYPNLPDSIDFRSGGELTLWRQLKLRSYPYSKSLKLTVQLEVLDAHTVLAKLMDGNQIRDTKRLKGKIRDGYFYLRTKSTYWGVPIVYWAVLGLRTRLGVNSTGQLFADSNYSHGGGILILTAGSIDDWCLFYNKK